MKITEYRKIARADEWFPKILPDLIEHGGILGGRPSRWNPQALNEWVATTLDHVAFHPGKGLTGAERNQRREVDMGSFITQSGTWVARAAYLEVYFILHQQGQAGEYQLFPLEQSNHAEWGSKTVLTGLDSGLYESHSGAPRAVVKKTQADISGFRSQVAIDIFKLPYDEALRQWLEKRRPS